MAPGPARSESQIVESARGEPTTGALLLGHTHWDHIQGLPFFAPLYGPGQWDVYGPRGMNESLRQTLAAQMRYPYFPVTIDQLGGGINYHELVEGVFDIDDVVVRTQYLNHPALTLGVPPRVRRLHRVLRRRPRAVRPRPRRGRRRAIEPR